MHRAMEQASTVYFHPSRHSGHVVISVDDFENFVVGGGHDDLRAT
jgi:hypothetical protein